MKLLRQGDNECYLASLAMLTDHSVEDVRRVAEQSLGMCYHLLWSISYSEQAVCFVRMMKHLAAVFDITLEYQKHPIPSYQPTQGTEPRDLCKSDLRGKGVLSYWLVPGTPGHSVAFEDGVIFNPDFPIPLAYNEWRRDNPYICDWRIERLNDDYVYPAS